jgi:hypothetical protein
MSILTGIAALIIFLPIVIIVGIIDFFVKLKKCKSSRVAFKDVIERSKLIVKDIIWTHERNKVRNS